MAAITWDGTGERLYETGVDMFTTLVLLSMTPLLLGTV